jgi:hypothetical protein
MPPLQLLALQAPQLLVSQRVFLRLLFMLTLLVRAAVVPVWAGWVLPFLPRGGARQSRSPSRRAFM